MDWVSKDFDREFKDGEVEQAVAAIAEKSEEFKNIEGYKLALSCIDLTTLNSTDGPAQGDIIALKDSGFSADFAGLPFENHHQCVHKR